MPSRRPSLRDVAHAVGVSTMTVSRVLRGRPGVSEELRERVRASAESLGYRPDPVLRRLMHHLRDRRRAGLAAAVTAITDFAADDEPSYCQRLRRHAAARARELGFQFSVLRVDGAKHAWESLPRVLQARGVDGVLLLPMRQPLSLPARAWRGCSIVAATSSVLEPQFHRVTPDHAANARLLVARLVAQGRRRIGFVGTFTHSQRTHDAFPSALAWHHARLDLACPPLIHAPDAIPSVVEWFLANRPDVIVVGRAGDLARHRAELSRAGHSPAWALAGTLPPAGEFGGLDERHDLIGAAAIDVLAGLVARGERGAPDVATTISLPGNWIGRI